MNSHELRYNALRELIDARLRSLASERSPKEVNDACRYVLSAGGKRVRSVLGLLACEAVGGNAREALDVCAAIEIMHNFTLVHDDVMDNAAARRGKATVHTQWNVNTAILAGDILLGLAYEQALKSSSAESRRILEIFTSAFLEVCRGQALDLEFEFQRNVSISDYFRMIEKKTARLISTATMLGAVIGGGTESQIRSLKKFGHYLGRAFQLQDDLLDIVADEATLGKAIGGDIIEGKKTFLLLTSLERATGKDKTVLLQVINRNKRKTGPSVLKEKDKVQRVAALYTSTGAIAEARKRIAADTRRATEALQQLPKSNARNDLLWVAEMLLQRDS